MMESRRFQPLIDKLFWGILLSSAVLLISLTVVTALSHPPMLLVMVPIDLLTGYQILSPVLFGYVELREHTVFIKCGVFLKREFPSERIMSVKRERAFYAQSMLSLKNAFDHINIRYGTYDIITVSVKESEELIRELRERSRI